MKARYAVAAVMVALALLGCASTPREPEPTVVANLTAKNIETAMADAMMVTAAHLYRLLADERIGEPEGEISTGSSTFRWTDTDMKDTRGRVELVLRDHRLQSSLFSDEYRGYVFSGTVEMVLNGDAADLVMDLRLNHKDPQRYPVTRLEMELFNLEDDIDPENVDGFIRANGHDVPIADFARALQIGD